MPRFVPTPARATVLPWSVVALCYLGATVLVSLAETLVGDLDQLDDVEAIAAGSARLSTTGLLHLASGALLALALVGLAPLVWRSIVGRSAWLVLLLAVPCAGAFAMLHLLAVQTAAPGLDGAAMEQFLVERLGAAGGAWVVPILLVALLAPLAQVLLLVGLARVAVSSWWAPGIVLLGAAVHAVVPGEAVETLSHWTMSLGVAVAAYGVWRQGRPASPEATDTPQRTTSPTPA